MESFPFGRLGNPKKQRSLCFSGFSRFYVGSVLVMDEAIRYGEGGDRGFKRGEVI